MKNTYKLHQKIKVALIKIKKEQNGEKPKANNLRNKRSS
jgi:hypothetical protein